MSKSCSLIIDVFPENFVICRLSSTSSLPAWAFEGPFISVTKTKDELSIITVENDRISKDVQLENNWRCFKLRGPFSFDVTGILASILTPLCNAEIPILAVSTFETDYVLVKEKNLSIAIDVLRQNGHEVNVEPK